MEAIDISALSFYKPLGYQNNTCGYCKSKNTSPSYYVTSSRVRPEHYQDLMDRGWRRSGRIYYKPDLPRSCCPHYSIRLHAPDFRSRKEQRHTLNKWNNFVLGRDYIKAAQRLCPASREEKKRRRNHFDLVHEVHRSEYANVKRPIDPSTKVPIEPAHKFEVSLESDSCSESKWKLFQTYQHAVHKESLAKNGKSTFERFLCSGLRREEIDGHEGQEKKGKKKLGSYHQVYRLDGKIIAIGVLDLLPHAVSAVYVVYDPRFEGYGFGKLSALREISLALEDDYQYYYMGYYIHSCVKMRYKGDFRPQHLLDPETLEWQPLDASLMQILDTTPYYSRASSQRPPDQTVFSSTDVSQPQSLSNSNSDDSDLEPDIPLSSLFTFDPPIPGVLTIEQLLSTCDLDHWRLMIQGSIVEFEDLVGWENSDLLNPQSIKGIAGELAACLGGGRCVKEGVMMLFD